MKKKEVKLSQNIEDFLNYLKYERKLSNNTYESYRYNLIKILEYFHHEQFEIFYIIQKKVVKLMLII